MMAYRIIVRQQHQAIARCIHHIIAMTREHATTADCGKEESEVEGDTEKKKAHKTPNKMNAEIFHDNRLARKKNEWGINCWKDKCRGTEKSVEKEREMP